MSKVRVLVGTKKGAFILSADGKREKWEVSGPHPAAGLRAVDAIRIHGRTLEVVNLPAGEMGAADFPLFTLAIGRQNKCALLRANQHSNLAHLPLLLFMRFVYTTRLCELFKDPGKLSYPKTAQI